MEVSPQLLYALMVVIAATLALLAVLTTFVNLRRSRLDRRSAKLVAELRPQVLEALEGGRSLELDRTDRGRETFIALARGLLPTLRGGERDALARLVEESGAVDVALRDLHVRSAVRRACAADLLGRASVPRAVPELIRLLDDRDADVRQTAARALGLIGSARAVPALLRTIDAGTVPLNTSTMAILRMGRDARSPLIDGLRAGSDFVRAICAELLGLLGAISALPVLTEAVQTDPTIEVRIRAARALGAIGAPGSVDALVTAMGRAQPVAVRAVATRALGRIGGRRTITVLRDALDAPEHVVAANAAQALASIGADGEELLSVIAGERATRRARYARQGLSLLSLTRTPASHL